MYRRSIGKQHGKCGRIVASRTLARSCSNVLASPAGALFKLRNVVGAKGARTFAVMAKSVPSKQFRAKTARRVLSPFCQGKRAQGIPSRRRTSPLFSLRWRTVAGQSTNGATFCGASLRNALPQAFVFFCYVRRRLTKRTAKGIVLRLRLKKPKAFFTGQTCRTPCRTRKVLPPCGQHFYIKACRYLPKKRKKNKK